MREASIPVAEAFAVGESQLADEALALQQQLEDERQARLREQQARLQAERRLMELQDNSPPASFPDSEPRKTSTTATSTRPEEETPNEEKAGRSKVFLGVALIVLAIAAVGGVCGSGNCSSKSSALSEQNQTAESEQDPFSSSVPTGFPSNFTSMPTTASFNMSASPMPIDTTFATEIPIAAATEIPTSLAPIPAPRSQPTVRPLPQPTVRPLPQPTPRPVSPPTRSPVTPRPTQSPVTRPTPQPIVPPSPRPVAPPTPQPTTTTSRSESIVSYINSISLSGRTLSYPNDNVLPEEEALNWLIEDDVGTSETDERTIRQRFALATLWFANGPFDFDHLSTWLTSTDECDWLSIGSCVGGEVTSVWLFLDGLNGQLPSDLALLTALTWLELAINQLTGSIPTEFGLLTALTSLELFNNQLTGSIPTEFGLLTTLPWLDLDSNQLTGTIPTEFGLLTELTSLSLFNNQLTGSIPTEFGLLTALTGLNLHANQLTGTIPTELNRMTTLTTFLIYNNNVSGDMPFCDGTTRPTRFSRLEADCNEVSCPCCTECCPNGGFEGIPSAGTLFPCDA